MDKLLEDKLNLVNHIHDISVKMISVSLGDSVDELNELIEQRQTLMDKVSDIDKNVSPDKTNAEYNLYDTKIKSIIKDIIEIDKELNKKIDKQKSVELRKINEIDKNQRLKNYTMDEKYVKEKGHFIKFKG